MSLISLPGFTLQRFGLDRFDQSRSIDSDRLRQQLHQDTVVGIEPGLSNVLLTHPQLTGELFENMPHAFASHEAQPGEGFGALVVQSNPKPFARICERIPPMLALELLDVIVDTDSWFHKFLCVTDSIAVRI